MATIINNLDIGQKEISFDELLLNRDFLYKLSKRLEDLEDQMLGKYIEKSDIGDYVGEDEVLNSLDVKIGKKVFKGYRKTG